MEKPDEVYGIPLPMDRPYPCSSLNNTVEALFHMAGKVDGDVIGHNRVVPNSFYCLDDIWVAAPVVAKEEGVALGTIKQIPASKEIEVSLAVSPDKAGCPMDTDIKERLSETASQLTSRSGWRSKWCAVVVVGHARSLDRRRTVSPCD